MDVSKFPCLVIPWTTVLQCEASLRCMSHTIRNFGGQCNVQIIHRLSLTAHKKLKFIRKAWTKVLFNRLPSQNSCLTDYPQPSLDWRLGQTRRKKNN